jgi:hypothetical protein
MQLHQCPDLTVLGASRPVSYLANDHPATCDVPLLILCLASYYPYALTPEIQRDVEAVDLKEKANQRGLVVWFVGGTGVVEDWADTIARRDQGGQM